MVRLTIFLGLIVSLSACSAGYIMRAAYEESKILLNREDIDSVIADSETDLSVRQKLTLVKSARQFAEELGLKPGKSFTKYSDINRDVLSWVLVASKKDSFSLKTWWFPIVGTVPYKGYFDKEDALSEAKNLLEEGYEAWIRPTEAFSTLGYFNDPVLSTTLKNPDHRIVETIIHESVHSTIWVGDNVAFNESLANFVGTQGSLEFFSRDRPECGESGCEADLKEALENRSNEIEVGALISELYRQLDELYVSSLSSDEKIRIRSAIFEGIVAAFRTRNPHIPVLAEINNAAIMQLRLYMTRLELFERLWDSCGKTIPQFVERIRQVAEEVKDKKGSDPFVVLENSLQNA